MSVRARERERITYERGDGEQQIRAARSAPSVPPMGPEQGVKAARAQHPQGEEQAPEDPVEEETSEVASLEAEAIGELLERSLSAAEQ